MKVEIKETKYNLTFLIWNQGDNSKQPNIRLVYRRTANQKKYAHKIFRRDQATYDTIPQIYFEHLLKAAGADITKYLELRYPSAHNWS